MSSLLKAFRENCGLYYYKISSITLAVFVVFTYTVLYMSKLCSFVANIKYTVRVNRTTEFIKIIKSGHSRQAKAFLIK